MQNDCNNSFMSPNYVAERTGKRLQESILKCKNKRGSDDDQQVPVPSRSVVRRNERERNRVRMVNNGFATLRQHVPKGVKNKKMSKVETLKSAVEYIRELQQLLNQEASGFVPSVKTEASYGSEEGSEAEYFHEGAGNCIENVYPHEELLMDRMQGVAAGAVFQTEHSGDVQSPTYSLTGSPAPSWASENNSSPYSNEAPDEDDILTFATWFS